MYFKYFIKKRKTLLQFKKALRFQFKNMIIEFFYDVLQYL